IAKMMETQHMEYEQARSALMETGRSLESLSQQIENMVEDCRHQSRGKRFQMTGANNEGENHKTRFALKSEEENSRPLSQRGHSTNCQEGLLELETNADKQAEAARCVSKEKIKE
ncbi:hypothetical protein XENORESO_001354, partial [Xenotaenia resolanae]